MAESTFFIEMEIQIQEKLNEIERTNNVKILFAVEAGSRSWSAAGSDSDYDIRFVYVYQPLSQYLSYDRIGYPYADTIQFKSDDKILDFSGWDLSKYLRMLSSLNISLIECCASPIVYRDNQPSTLEMSREFIKKNATPALIMPSFMGMMLSKKASVVETVKSAMYLARLSMIVHMLHDRKIIPKMFDWFYLVENVDLDESIKKQMMTLHGLKTGGNKNLPPPEELKEFLQQEREWAKSITYEKELLSSIDTNIVDTIWRSQFAAMIDADQ